MSDHPPDKGNAVASERLDKLFEYISEVRKDSSAELETEYLLELFSNTLEELRVITEELRVRNSILESSQRQSEVDRQRYHDLFEYAPDAYLVTDLSGKILEANAAAAELLGLSSQNLRMKALALYLDKEDRSLLLQFLKAFSSGEIDKAHNIEFKLRPRRKESPIVSVSIRAVGSNSGIDCRALRWIIRDFTQKHEQERQLAESARNLLEKNAELEQWAAVTAHDLKEPVRVMTLYSELLREKYEDVLQGDGETYLKFISTAATKGLSLIQDLLTFHSLGARKLNFRRLNLRQPLNDAIETVQPALTECGGDIVCGKMPEITADGAQLSQLFYNLLSNAIKFRSPLRKLVIRVEAVRQPSHWMILVHDNGIGFEMEYSGRIFVLFERLNPEDAYQGNGIGLALCRRIAENHGGELSAVSTPDVGTTMSLTLPCP